MLYLIDSDDRGSSLSAAFLLEWLNFNPSMDKLPHAQLGVGENYLSIPKVQRYNRRSLRMDK